MVVLYHWAVYPVAGQRILEKFMLNYLEACLTALGTIVVVSTYVAEEA